MKKKNFKAFTLAEILITLSIIGVVAALTIPTLIQRTGNEEYVSRLNKVYSTLSQATEAIMTENGAPNVWCTNADNLYNAYKSHLRTARDCGSAQGCFKQIRGKNYKCLNGSTTQCTSDWDSNTKLRKLILSDGTQVMFSYNEGSVCTDNSICASIAVDINGEKAPNQNGRDVFSFGLYKDGLAPRGCREEQYIYGCNPSAAFPEGDGGACTCKVIAEGAMNY